MFEGQHSVYMETRTGDTNYLIPNPYTGARLRHPYLDAGHRFGILLLSERYQVALVETLVDEIDFVRSWNVTKQIHRAVGH